MAEKKEFHIGDVVMYTLTSGDRRFKITEIQPGGRGGMLTVREEIPHGLEYRLYGNDCVIVGPKQPKSLMTW